MDVSILVAFAAEEVSLTKDESFRRHLSLFAVSVNLPALSLLLLPTDTRIILLISFAVVVVN